MHYDPNPQGLVWFYNYILDFLSGTVRHSITSNINQLIHIFYLLDIVNTL